MDDPEWERFVEHVRETTVKQMAASGMVMQIAPDEPDVQVALQLGLSILLDKPLLVIVMPGRTPGQRLRRVADRVVEADIDTEEGREKLLRVLDEMGLRKEVV